MFNALFYKALGWALVHSLWQFGFLWILYFTLTSLRSMSASLRHALALGLSLTGVVWFGANLLLGWTSGSPEGLGLIPIVSAQAGPVSFLQKVADQYLVYVTYAYLLVTGLQFSKFVYAFYRSNSLYTSGVAKVEVHLRQYVARMAMHLHIRRRVQVFISEWVDTPMVIGFLKPTILMPLACVNQLTVDQVESILLHELAHIKRNDYLINMYVAACEILFFFNPFARLLLSAVKSEREHSCDDWVLQYQFNPHAYASALLTLEKSRLSYVQTSLAATGLSRRILLHRVQRILNVPVTRKNRLLPFTALLTACSLLLFFACLHPQIIPDENSWRKEFAAMVRKFPHHKRGNTEQPQVIRINELTVSTPAKRSIQKAIAVPSAPPVSPTSQEDPANDLIIPASINEEINLSEPVQVQAVNIETRNFALPEPPPAEAPVTVTLGGAYPYVPSSVYFSIDTVKPRVKVETYRERTAKEAMIKAQRALNEVDWTSIEKSLKKNKNVAELRAALEKAMTQLNWQQIDAEVKDSLNQATRLDYKRVLTEELQQVDKWKTQSVQLEKLQGQLQLQQQKYKTESEIRELQIQKQIPRNKVIVVL